jgi:hypothetical protein
MQDLFDWAAAQNAEGKSGDLSVNLEATLTKGSQLSGPYGMGEGSLEFWPSTVRQIGALRRQQPPYFMGPVQFTLDVGNLPAKDVLNLPETSPLKVTIQAPQEPPHTVFKPGAPPPPAWDSLYGISIAPWGDPLVLVTATEIADTEAALTVAGGSVPNVTVTLPIAYIAPSLPIAWHASVTLRLSAKG